MSIWNNLYQAYEKKDCESFKKYFYALTEEDKKSPYFSYYASLKSKLCPQENKKGKIMMKWKVIKCPSCGSPLTLSEYNKEQIKKLKNGEKQVEFICNYCGEKFVWNVKPFKSLFTSYAIWKEVTIKLKKYKIIGWVKYKWTYEEEWILWGLEYIEWLAINEKWNIIYIAESVSLENGKRYTDIEISQKIDFPFTVKYYDKNNIETSKGIFEVDEYDDMEVVKVAWDVGKWYTIWERVKLYNFDKYILEEEKTKNWIERNLYVNYYSQDLYDKKGLNDIYTSMWKYAFKTSDYVFYIQSLIIFVFFFLISWYNLWWAFWSLIAYTLVLRNLKDDYYTDPEKVFTSEFIIKFLMILVVFGFYHYTLYLVSDEWFYSWHYSYVSSSSSRWSSSYGWGK